MHFSSTWCEKRCVMQNEVKIGCSSRLSTQPPAWQLSGCGCQQSLQATSRRAWEFSASCGCCTFTARSLQVPSCYVSFVHPRRSCPTYEWVGQDPRRSNVSKTESRVIKFNFPPNVSLTIEIIFRVWCPELTI